jgi:F0F1-type ATP synthase delta subunit
MRAAHYAHALEELLKEQPGKETELVERLLIVVHENGHDHLLKKILRSFTKLHERDAKKSTIEVVTSSPITESEVQKLLKVDPYKRILLADHKHVKRTVDDTIVGGAIIRTGGQRIDQSYKRALIELYQHITK